MSGSPWSKERKSLASDNSQKAILLATFYKAFETWLTDISREIIKKTRRLSQSASMTSVVVRIAQGFGLHLDGADAGLTPFDTEMRRRLWWRNISVLDNIHRCSYTTRFPLTIDDDDFGPASIELPTERAGANIIVSLYRDPTEKQFYHRRLNHQGHPAAARVRPSLLAPGGRRPAGNATDADPWGHVAEQIQQGFEGGGGVGRGEFRQKQEERQPPSKPASDVVRDPS
ncbi:hypothetical protein Egran_03640, partial [Elaphomyces granulatus]